MGSLRVALEVSAMAAGARAHLQRRSFPAQFLSKTSLWFSKISSSSSKSLNTSSSSSSFGNSSSFLSWRNPPEAVAKDEGEAWTAVLLGWLGAEQRHLRRYAEMYGSRGMRTVSFVVPVDELAFDLGRGVEEKIGRFAAELAAWVEGGPRRRLLFHTFSNTGWFTYGAILENLRSRKDILEKIGGCVVDSGADPEINPQVWAAGFSAALMKKRRQVALALEEVLPGDTAVAEPVGEERDVPELVVLSILEKLFSFVLKLPDVNQRLSKIISILSHEQPPCPQLYLYSSADRVIPARSVELFIESQRDKGREVHAHDFRVSPHVDHLRTFPRVYSAKLHDFLHGCTAKHH
ncbi:alpha/beta-Hydrolases superfamily protein [Wolffia australiana]